MDEIDQNPRSLNARCSGMIFMSTLYVGGECMAKNTGSGFRRGAVTERSQTQNPTTGIWTKRGPDGKFMDGKADGTPFKGVRKEK